MRLTYQHTSFVEDVEGAVLLRGYEQHKVEHGVIRDTRRCAPMSLWSMMYLDDSQSVHSAELTKTVRSS